LSDWKTNKIQATGTTKNMTFCYVLSELGMTYIKNQGFCILQPILEYSVYFNILISLNITLPPSPVCFYELVKKNINTIFVLLLFSYNQPYIILQFYFKANIL